MDETEQLTRADLYDLVWNQPMKDLPEVLGVSANSVKNACRKFNIPVPDRGYWTQIKAGKTVKRPAMPERSPGMTDRVVFGAADYRRSYGYTADFDKSLPTPPVFATSIEDVKQAIFGKMTKVSVPRGKHVWHHVIQRLFAADEKRRVKYAESQWNFSWDRPLFDNPFEQRRLRIMNALFLAVSKFSGKPTINGREGIEVSFQIHQQHVPVKIMATSDIKRKNSYRAAEDLHSAKEPISIIVPDHFHSDGVRIAWADSEEEKLEAQLTEVAVEIVWLAEVFHREATKRQYDWLIERRADYQKRLIEEEAQRQEAIRVRKGKFLKAKREMLLGHAQDMDDARTLRELVDQVLAVKGDQMGEELKSWAAFVAAEADRIDPVTDDRFLEVMRLELQDFEE